MEFETKTNSLCQLVTPIVINNAYDDGRVPVL